MHEMIEYTSFLYRSRFVDYENTSDITEEPDIDIDYLPYFPHSILGLLQA
jgi:hypothetical protein